MFASWLQIIWFHLQPIRFRRNLYLQLMWFQKRDVCGFEKLCLQAATVTDSGAVRKSYYTKILTAPIASLSNYVCKLAQLLTRILYNAISTQYFNNLSRYPVGFFLSNYVKLFHYFILLSYRHFGQRQLVPRALFCFLLSPLYEQIFHTQQFQFHQQLSRHFLLVYLRVLQYFELDS